MKFHSYARSFVETGGRHSCIFARTRIMGALEIALIFLVYLMFFGSKGIPSLARTMGQAVRSFREATSDIQREIMRGADDIRDNANQIKKTVESDDE